MSLIVPLHSPKLREDESSLPAPVRKTDPSTFESYLHDASNFHGNAESVIIPHSEKQISDILKKCSAEKIPVTVEGAHTGLAGGGVPMGGVVLSLEKLSSISGIKINGSSGLTVGAGTILRDVQDYAEKLNYLYTPDPTERSALIGATAATNASGPRTFKYGATRPYVRRLRVVLASGHVLDLERGKYILGEDRIVRLEGKGAAKFDFQIPYYAMPYIKSAAGYYVKSALDLIDLFIGSEGTLGVITELDLSLVSLPEKFISMVVFFENEKDAIEFVINARRRTYENRKIKTISGLDARALEYFDLFSLELIRGKFPNIPRNAQSAVFLEQELGDASEDELLEMWLKLMSDCHALSDQSWFGMDRKKQEEFRDFRHEVPVVINEIMARRGLRKVGTDMAVPDNQLETMMSYYRDTIKKSGMDSATFGHIGNNHLHVNLLPKNKEEYDLAWALYRKWVEKSIQLGGTISAEHGIGKLKAPFLELMYGPEVVQQMAEIKKAFDSSCILGRGNIFKESYLS